MRKTFFTLAILAAYMPLIAQNLKPAIPYDKKLEAKVERTLRKLTLEEKVGQMCELTIDVILITDTATQWCSTKRL